MDRRCEDLLKLKEQLKEAKLRLEEAVKDPESKTDDMLWLYAEVIDLMGRVNFARQDDDPEEDEELEEDDEEYICEKRAQDAFWREMDNDPWDDEPRSDVVDEEE